MPFTPFHFGPGLLTKAVFPRGFSFTVYAATQVAIDLEPGYWLFKREFPLHRGMHTVAGAIGIALVAALVVAPVARAAHRIVARWPGVPLYAWLSAANLSWRVIVMSALVGAVGHVALDSIMHSDALPLAPFSTANPLLGLISSPALYLACLLSGLLACVYALAVSPKQEGSKIESVER